MIGDQTLEEEVQEDGEKKVLTVEEITEAHYDLLMFQTLKGCKKVLKKAERNYLAQYDVIGEQINVLNDMMLTKRMLKLDNRLRYYVDSEGSVYYQPYKTEIGFQNE